MLEWPPRRQFAELLILFVHYTVCALYCLCIILFVHYTVCDGRAAVSDALGMGGLQGASDRWRTFHPTRTGRPALVGVPPLSPTLSSWTVPVL
eukprot:963114-Prorocentrum_minimum.AAC.1